MGINSYCVRIRRQVFNLGIQIYIDGIQFLKMGNKPVPFLQKLGGRPYALGTKKYAENTVNKNPGKTKIQSVNRKMTPRSNRKYLGRTTPIQRKVTISKMRAKSRKIPLSADFFISIRLSCVL